MEKALLNEGRSEHR